MMKFSIEIIYVWSLQVKEKADVLNPLITGVFLEVSYAEVKTLS